MFKAVFTVATRWKQSKCPSTDEWVNKMKCNQSYSGNIKSALKTKDILIHAITCMLKMLC